MLSHSQLTEIKTRTEIEDPNPSMELLSKDRALLLAEVERLTKFVGSFSDQVNEKLDLLEADMERLEKENERLRKMCKSANTERDVCISLIAKMAVGLGIPVGIGQYEVAEEDSSGQSNIQLQNRIILELPSGQVSWDFLDAESHLFEGLPKYEGALEIQTIQETYSKIMNPELDRKV